jgi:hypothetical protein
VGPVLVSGVVERSAAWAGVRVKTLTSPTSVDARIDPVILLRPLITGHMLVRREPPLGYGALMTDATEPAADGLTKEDRTTIRNAEIGAASLVSRAEPGFFSMFKESAASSGALKAAPAEVQALFQGAGFPSRPEGKTAAEIEAGLLGQVTDAVALLTAKAPDQVQGFKDVLIAMCDAVAGAAKGVSAEESAMVDKVRLALG